MSHPFSLNRELQNLTALNDSEQHGDDSDDEKNMDETARGVGRHQTERPENDEDHCEYEHESLPFRDAIRAERSGGGIAFRRGARGGIPPGDAIADPKWTGP